MALDIQYSETDPLARSRFSGFSDCGAERTHERLDLVHGVFRPPTSISSAAINTFNSFHRTRLPSASMTNWIYSAARRGRCELPIGTSVQRVRPLGDDGRASSATPLFRPKFIAVCSRV